VNNEMSAKLPEIKQLFEQVCEHLAGISPEVEDVTMRRELDQFLVDYRKAHDDFAAECLRAEAELNEAEERQKQQLKEVEAQRGQQREPAVEEPVLPTEPDPAVGRRLQEEVLARYIWPLATLKPVAAPAQEVWEMSSSAFQSQEQPAAAPLARPVAPPASKPSKPTTKGDEWSSEWKD
jgi:hypothetical protein